MFFYNFGPIVQHLGLYCCFISLLLSQIVVSRINAVPTMGYDNSNAPIPAAINSHHTVDIKNVDLPSSKPYTPGTIEVKSDMLPSFIIKFNSASSKVNLFHHHQPSEVPSTKTSFSQDEPHILKHRISKPIVQEVHEIISPYRRIIQEIKPVVESINTIISRKSTDKSKDDSLRSDDSLKSFGLNLEDIFGQNTNPNTNNQIEMVSREEEEGDKDNRPMADQVLTYEDLADNSVYNGHNELDLKYISPNVPGKVESALYQTVTNHSPKLYKDR